MRASGYADPGQPSGYIGQLSATWESTSQYVWYVDSGSQIDNYPFTNCKCSIRYIKDVYDPGNVSPTDIALSNNTINEHGLINDTVGALSSTDADVGSTFTYTLVTGKD
jgi:hypothetical protein